MGVNEQIICLSIQKVQMKENNQFNDINCKKTCKNIKNSNWL